MKKIVVKLLIVLTIIFGVTGMTNDVHASANVIVGGVDLGYSEGAYFSKTGSACSCHGRGTCGSAADCTCIVVSGCCQCYGWSMWIENKLFGCNEISNASNFSTVISRYSNCTGNDLYNKFNGNVGAGAHIRTKNSVKGYAHSVSVISYDANGIKITDCNHSGKCQIDIRDYTWDGFAAFLNSYGGIEFVNTCKSGIIPTPSNEYPVINSWRYEYFNNGVRPVVEIKNPSSISSVTFYLRFGTTAEWKSYSGKFNLDNAWYCEASYDELLGTGDVVCHVYIYGKDGSQQSFAIEKPKVESTRYEYFNNGIRPVVGIENPSSISSVTFYLRFGTTAKWKSYSGKFNLNNAWYCEAPYDELEGAGSLVCDVYVDGKDGSHEYVQINQDIDITNIEGKRCEYFENGIRPVVTLANPSKVSKVTFKLRFGTTAEWKSYSGKFNLNNAWYCEASYDELKGTGLLSCEAYVDLTDGTQQYIFEFSNNVCNHIYDAGVVTTEATCTKAGVKTYTCSACDDTKTESILATGNHAWDKGTITKQATELTEGTKTYACATCGQTKLEIIPKLNHTHKIGEKHEALAATCSEKGAVEYYDCTGCSEKLDKSGNVLANITTDIDNSNHTGSTEVKNKKEESCGIDGYTGDVYCKDCGERISNGTTILATGNHAWDKGTITKQATELTEGTKTYACTICGQTKLEIIPKLNHTHKIGEKHEALAATCSEKGTVEYYDCTGCNKKLDKFGNVLANIATDIDNSNHTGSTEVKNEKEESCGIDGYTGDVYCKDCGERISNGTTISATGNHVEKASVIKATITKEGSIIYKCTLCGKITKIKSIAYPKTFTLSKTKYMYDGKVKKPSLKIYNSEGKLIKTSEYTITYDSGRKKVGVYTYKITFKGKYYTGNKTVSFVIIPKKTNLKKISVGKKYITVYASCKASSLGGNGYQIAYRVSGKTKWKYKHIKSKNKKISGLIKGKKYQVMIRGYKKVGNVIYYGAWSSKKTSAKVK